MIEYTVEISPEAEREIVQAAQWYAQKNRLAADVFRTTVFDSIDTISHSPLSWAKVSEDGIRKFVLPRYPYSLFFTVLGSTVEILTVAHNRRMPGYWRKG